MPAHWSAWLILVPNYCRLFSIAVKTRIQIQPNYGRGSYLCGHVLESPQLFVVWLSQWEHRCQFAVARYLLVKQT